MKRISTIVLGLVLSAAGLRAQWLQTSGPEGGYISTIAANESGVVAAAWPNQVYRYSQTCGCWEKAGTLDAVRMVGAGDVFIASTPGGMKRSDDMGETWSPVDAPEGAQIEESRGGVFYAIDSTTLLRSSDGGFQWSRFGQGWDTIGAAHSKALSLTTLGDTIIVVGNGGVTGVIRSLDRGATWQIAGGGLPAGSTISRATLIGKALVAQVYDTATRFSLGIYLSTDMGTTWEESNEGRMSNESGYRHVYQFFPDAGSIGAATAAGTIRLQAGSWVGTSDRLITGIVTDPGGDVFRSDFTGISRSDDDGQTWERIDRGLVSQNVLAITSSGKAIIASGGNGIYRSTDKGLTWSRTGEIRAEQFAHTGNVVLARGSRYSTQGIRRSSDSGRTWADATMGIEHPVDWITSIAATSELAYVSLCSTRPFDSAQALFEGGIYRSTDGGENWSLMTNGLPQQDDTTLGFLAVAAEGQTAVAVATDGMFRSTDGGNSWQATGFGFRPFRSVRSLLAHNGRYYLSIGTDVWVSENLGETWTLAGGMNLPSMAFSLSIYRGALTAVAGGYSGTWGILTLVDNKWVPIAPQLPEQAVVREIIEVDGTTYLATTTSSVLRLSDGSAGVEQPASKLPTAWSSLPLHANATLQITLEKSAPTVVELVDMTGRTALRFDAGLLSAGSHSLSLPVGGLEAGVYAYRISAGSLLSRGSVVVAP